MSESNRETHRETAIAEAEVRALCARLEESWDRGDGAAYGALFTEDATYVVVDGSVSRGRAEITRGHQAIFDTFFKGSKLHGDVVGVRFLRPDVAIVLRSGAVQPAGRPAPSGPEAMQSLVAVKEKDGWRFAAFQNTAIARGPR